MIRAKEMILQQLHTGTFLFQKFTDDLLDEEYFIAPTTGGNHTAWNLGHIACVEDAIVSGICSGQPQLSKVVRDLFASGASCSVDAARYPSRAEIDSLFSETRERTVSAVEELDDALWNDPPPPSFPRELFPTRGAAWSALGTHQFWHLGEVAVCRTALGKDRVLQ